MNASRYMRPPPLQVILRSKDQSRLKVCFEVKTTIVRPPLYALAAVYECLSGGCDK
jgi:hypothetical protein